MPSRFVILHHQLNGGEHWDFMLEHEEVLLTWQLAREPINRADLPIPATRIGDHRKAYLDYEGEISGGRGTVRRVDGGTVEFELPAPADAERYRFRLSGGSLSGRFLLARDMDGWVLSIADAQGRC